MIRNYFRIAIRNLKKYKAFSLINIIGLAVGLACCIVISLYVRDELSYDRFNKNADQIYRVYLNAEINHHKLHLANTCAPLGQAFTQNFPEVLNYTRIRNFGYPLLRYKDKVFSEEKFYWADSTFFDVFTVKFIEGNPQTALSQPNQVVLTEAMAKKYFGTENPMGKILKADQKRNYIVTGVVKAFPQNSHFHFDFLASLSTYSDSKSHFWLSNNYYTYLLLRKGTDPDKFQKKFNAYIRKIIGPQVKLATGVSFDKFLENGSRYEYKLQPLTSIHLHSHLDGELEPNSDISYIYIFSVIALAILLIACINFMNLSTARSERRAMEVGIRKTLGSNKTQLVAQFIVESIFMSIISVFLAVGIVESLLPLFNDISGKSISLGIFSHLYSIPVLIIFAVVVGIIAGSYPAFFLSSFMPMQVLKKDKRKGSRNSLLRSGLVIFQFSVSIILFIGTLVIYNQLHYIMNKNLGFNKEKVVVIKKTDDIGTQIESFKYALSDNKNVISVSNSTQIPGSDFGGGTYKIAGTPSQNSQLIWRLFADYNFLKTYQIKLDRGRAFSKDHPSDTMAVIINQAAVKAFVLKNPIGKQLVQFGSKPGEDVNYKIIGVIKDFNFQSLHQKIRPLVIFPFLKGQWGKYVSVRIAGGNYQKTISFLNNTWKKFAGNEAFEYNFFDRDWAHLYASEQVTSKIASIFSILAIFIACLGLLGLAAFVTEQRTKEIGIRKVLGATVTEIVFLLSKEFTKWVLISNIIAWPVAYYVMNNWLSDFAYRVNIGVGIFVLSGVIALMIALFTVSTHAIRAATANPAKALKYE